MLAKGLMSQVTPSPPSLAFRTVKEVCGEYPELGGSKPLPQLFTRSQLLTESLVVIPSFVCPNKSLDFDNVIYMVPEVLQAISIALSSLVHPCQGLNLYNFVFVGTQVS